MVSVECLFFSFSFTVTKVSKTGSGKAVTNRYSECVFVALGIQYEMRMRHIIICDLSSSTVLFHFISFTHDFRNSVSENKMHVWIFPTTIFGKVSHCKKQYHLVQNWKCSGYKILIKGILDILKIFQVYIINTSINDK